MGQQILSNFIAHIFSHRISFCDLLNRNSYILRVVRFEWLCAPSLNRTRRCTEVSTTAPCGHHEMDGRCYLCFTSCASPSPWRRVSSAPSRRPLPALLEVDPAPAHASSTPRPARAAQRPCCTIPGLVYTKMTMPHANQASALRVPPRPTHQSATACFRKHERENRRRMQHEQQPVTEAPGRSASAEEVQRVADF